MRKTKRKLNSVGRAVLLDLKKENLLDFLCKFVKESLVDPMRSALENECKIH